MRFAETPRRLTRTYLGVWPRMVLPLGVIFLGYVVGLVVLAVAMRPLLVSRAEDVRAGTGDATLLAVIALVPVLVLLGAAGIVWAGATVFVADGVDADRATSPWRSTARALRRLPAGVGAFVVWMAAVAVAVLVFPVFVLAGVLGLALTPVVRRTRWATRWPSWRELVVMVVPFGGAFLIGTRWSLTFPAVFLDGVGVRRACAHSWRSVRGRTLGVAGYLAVTMVVIVGLTFAVRSVLEPILSGSAQVIVAQLLAQVLVSPMLLVTLAVLYRNGGAAPLDRPPLAPVPGSSRPGVAVAVVVALVVQLGVVLLPANPASAAPASATPTTPDVVAAACPAAPVGSTVEFSHSPDFDVPIAAGVPTDFEISVDYQNSSEPCEWTQPSGDVSVYVDNVPLPGGTQTLPPGKTGFPNTVLTFSTTFGAGTHEVKAVYEGDATFCPGFPAIVGCPPGSGEHVFSVVAGAPSVTTPVTVAASPVVYGQPVTYAADVTGGAPAPTGNVRFFTTDGAFSQTAPLVGGTATLTTTSIPPGSHAVVAEYLGDAVHLGSDWGAPQDLVVFPAWTRTTLSLSPTAPTEAGETVTAAVTVTPLAPSVETPRGRVEISAGGTVLGSAGLGADGSVSLGVVPPPGTRSLTATFVPADGSWFPSSTTESHTVNALTPLLTLSASSNPTAFGDPLTLLATVTAGTPATGTVAFVARRVSAPATGTAAAVLTHSANLDAPLVADVETTFTVSLAGSVPGEVASMPSGQVTVRIDDGAVPVTPASRTLAADADNVEDLTFTAVFGPGPHRITISYAGDEGFAPFDEVIDVVAEEVAGTTPTSRPAAPAGPAAPTGPVPTASGELELGTGTLDADGRATLTTTALTPGLYTIEARYSGNAGIRPLTSAPLAQTISRAPVLLRATTADTAPRVGDSVRVRVVVSAPIPGADLFRQEIRLLDGTEEVGTGLLSSDAPTASTAATSSTASTSITFRTTAAGPRTLTAVYAGDEDLDPADATFDVTVARQVTGVRMFGSQARARDYGDPFTFEGVVTTPGSGTPTGTVRLVGNIGLLDTATLDADGRFSFRIDTLPATRPGGPHRIWAEYLGDEDFEPSSVLDLYPGRDDRISVEVAQIRAVPDVAFSPAQPTVGEQVTITATLPVRGAGPTGRVEFFDLSVNPRRSLGSAPLVDGVAELDFAPSRTRTLVLASYAGDRNYAPGENPSPYALLQAEPASATLTISGPTRLEHGSAGTLVVRATSAVTGGPAAGAITFRSRNDVLARNVRLDAGVARLEVCGGDAAVCPASAAILGFGAQAVTAEYSSSSGGAAPAVTTDVEVDPASTTLTLTSPGRILLGSEARLVAEVTFAGTRAVRRGRVVFEAVEVRDSGEARRFLTAVAVDADGKATARVDGGDDVAWPVERIEAAYRPADPRAYRPSTAANPVTIERITTSLEVTANAAPVGEPTRVLATLQRGAGGTAEDPTGTITITADDGTTCETRLRDGRRAGTCAVVWTTIAEHSYRATYSGDSLFEPSQATPFAITGTRGNPALRARIAPPVPVEDQTTTVTWVQPAGATGRVTVFADGRIWCEVDVSTLGCTGTFGRISAQEPRSTVRVRYWGDATWNGVEEELGVKVRGCYPIEVYTSEPAQGSVTVDTPPNCGGDDPTAHDRYLQGTEISVTATPTGPGGEFRGWLRLDDQQAGWFPKDGGPPDETTGAATTTFTIRDDFSTWALRAEFAVPCLRLDETIIGQGRLEHNTPPDCTLPDGSDGYTYGTDLEIVPFGTRNDAYDERDRFYRFENLPDDAQVFGIGDVLPNQQGQIVAPTPGNPTPLALIANNVQVRFSMTADTAFGAVFGPTCRTVNVAISLSGTTDPGTTDPGTTDPGTTDPGTSDPGTSEPGTTEVLTPENCSSPDVDGFTRATQVRVRATPDDDDLVRDGWDLDGTPDPALGRDAEAVVDIDDPEISPNPWSQTAAPAITVTARFVECFTLRAQAAPGVDGNGTPLGEVSVASAPNCPDDSPRYLAGTSVTLDPTVLAEGATFTGWQDGDGTFVYADRSLPAPTTPGTTDPGTTDPGTTDPGTTDPGTTDPGTTDPGTSAPPSPHARTIVVDDDLETFATFALGSVCSALQVNAPPGLVEFDTRISGARGVTDRRRALGCGPGSYYDAAKAFCLQEAADVASGRRSSSRCDTLDAAQIRERFGTELFARVNPDNRLTVLPLVRGRTPPGQGRDGSAPAAPPCFPRNCSSREGVSGDLFVAFDACQVIDSGVTIQRITNDGSVDPNDPTEYRPSDFGQAMGGYPWIQGYPESDCIGTGGGIGAWNPGSFVELRTSPPAVGFRFLGWAAVDNEVTTFTDATPAVYCGGSTWGTTGLRCGPRSRSNPGRTFEKEGIVVQTTSDRPRIRADALYGVQCGTLSVGKGVRIESPAPNCPGGPPGQNSYVIGTVVLVSAEELVDCDYYVDLQTGARVPGPGEGRAGGGACEGKWAGYSGGIIANTVTQDRKALALVGAPSNSVTARYLTSDDITEQALAQAGKYAVGLLAVAAPIALTIACGPCGVAIAALTASALLVDFIPGVDGRATAALKGTLLAPLTLAQCSARWGFQDGTADGYEPPPAGQVPSAQQTVLAAGNVIDHAGRAAYQAARAAQAIANAGTDTFGSLHTTTPGVAAQRALGLRSTPAGFSASGNLQSTAMGWRALRSARKYGVPALQFGFGVYDSGGFETDFTEFKTVDELRDTAAFQSCMSQSYRTLSG